MTQSSPMDFEKEAREVVERNLCGDSVCAFVDGRSCGCFQAVIALARRAYAAGERETMQRVAEWDRQFSEKVRKALPLTPTEE